jgi:hypothetical protein
MNTDADADVDVLMSDVNVKLYEGGGYGIAR